MGMITTRAMLAADVCVDRCVVPRLHVALLQHIAVAKARDGIHVCIRIAKAPATGPYCGKDDAEYADVSIDTDDVRAHQERTVETHERDLYDVEEDGENEIPESDIEECSNPAKDGGWKLASVSKGKKGKKEDSRCSCDHLPRPSLLNRSNL